MNLPEYSNARWHLAVLFSIPVVLSVLFFAINVADEQNETNLSKVEYVRSRVGAFRGIANDAEVGENGYLLTHDESYLAILESAKLRLQNETESLRRVPSDFDLRPKVLRVFASVGHRVQTADRTIAVERSQGFDAATELAREDGSERLMSSIRSEADSLQRVLQQRIDDHAALHQRFSKWSFLSFLFGTLTMLVVLLWLYNSFVSFIRSRDQAHAELRTLNAELEQRIEERTAELQRFNEELQQFAYVASHDLQEPLRTITSFAQLLSSRYQGKLDSDADEFIGYIVSSARRMTDLINGLLALVRLRKTGQARNPLPFDKLLAEARMGLQGAIRDSGARIEAGPLPTLVVDQIQFSQVFQNLISNAIKYRRDVAPHIRISAERDSTHWVIGIADNGRGFDQQFAERIFGLFQRLHGREVEGTGMGLSIARRIVERHGGRMWATSEEGVGSTFYFSLPVSLESHAPENDAAAVSA